MKTVLIEEIKHLAGLSQLWFTKEELESFTAEFNGILGMIEEIKKANVAEEINYGHAFDINELREDVAGKSMDRDMALINAPVKKRGCFNVPKVVE